MLEINKIRLNKEDIIELLKIKTFKDAEEKINTLIDLDEEKRGVQRELEEMKAELNLKSKTIGKLMKEGKKEIAEVAKKEVSQIKESSKNLEAKMVEKESEIQDLLLSIPNTPHISVPK